jgi:hypothetical protein
MNPQRNLTGRVAVDRGNPQVTKTLALHKIRKLAVLHAAGLVKKKRAGHRANYAAAVAAYYSGVRKLEAGMITGSADLYVKLSQATEETRAICEAARKKLDEHEAKHQCAA